MLTSPDALPGTSENRADLSRGVFLAALGALVLFYLAFSTYHLSTVPLIDPDEPRYAAAGRTMVRGGSLLVPEFNGTKRINKPPLFYWLVAGSMALSGDHSEIGARLPSIAMGLAMVLLTVFVGKRIYGARTGLLAGGILASSVLFVALSRSCVTDMTLSAFLSIALGFLLLALLERGPPKLLFWLAILSLGLALLTKATPALSFFAALILYRVLALPRGERAGSVKPILILFALALILSAAALYCAEQQVTPSARAKLEEGLAGSASAEQLERIDQFSWLDDILNSASLLSAAAAIVLIVRMAAKAGLGGLRNFPWAAAIPVAIAMGAWWYLALIQRFGWDEFQRLIGFEVGERIAGNVHREGMHYYLLYVLALILPWTAALPGALIAAWPDTRAEADVTTEQRADRYLIAWALGIGLFFSIPGAKLATYILPAFPALALSMARLITRWNSQAEPLSPRLKTWTTRLVFVFLSVLAIAGFVPLPYPDDFSRFLKALTLPMGVLGAGYAAALLVAALQMPRRPLIGMFVLYGASFAFVAAAAHAAFPVFLYGRSARALCLQSKEKLASCERILSMGAERESLSFYTDHAIGETRRRKVEENESLEDVVREELSRPERTALFIHRKYYARMLGLNAKKLPRDPEYLRKLAPDFVEFAGSNEQLVLLLPREKK